MPDRTVAIIGRPNVGKSALFNRLAGRKIAIVHDRPGVTRDRISTVCKLGSTPFCILDTGGIGADADASFSAQIHTEADIAIDTADAILFVVDSKDGMTPVDADLAAYLRRARKPILLVANKIDTAKHDPGADDFARLGLGSALPISAEHGRGIDDLVRAIEGVLPEAAPPELDPATAPPPPVSIAVVGRPNVGKSSLINAILQDRRTIVSDISGTTRDAIDIPYSRGDSRFTLIDTAGIRPRGKVNDSIEVFGVMRSEKSIGRANLCVLVIDATAGVTAQDKKIAGLIQEARKPCLIAANKWDIAEERDDKNEFLDRLRSELFFLSYAPLILLSAKTGQAVGRLFRAIDKVRRDSRRKIGTGPLNRIIQECLTANPPPIRRGHRFKIYYATQIDPPESVAIPTPSFLCFANDPSALVDPWRKYLENRLREEADFAGLPMTIRFRGREKELRGPKR